MAPSTQQRIHRRAQQLFENHGSIPGHDIEYWLRAEAEIKAENKAAFVLVKLNGITYTSQYDPNNCAGYTPGEFHPGDTICVRRDDLNLYLKRPNGAELQTRIVATK